MHDQMLDRAGGGLIGVAAGDALGATVEFQTPARIQQTIGCHRDITGGGVFGWRPGQGTDDSDMTAAVARAYATGYDLNTVAAGFLAWYRSRPRDIGGTTRSSLALLERTGDPTTSGYVIYAEADGRAAGNGSLMRALPTAIARTTRQARTRDAAEISAITHADPRCAQACIAYVEIAAALIGGVDPNEAIDRALAVPDVEHPDVLAALAFNAQTPVERVSTSGYVLDSLAAAVWAIQQPAQLEDTLVALVNRGDDADTTGAIAGGLLGCRDGAAALPARWVARLEYAAEFTDLASVLLANATSAAA